MRNRDKKEKKLKIERRERNIHTIMGRNKEVKKREETCRRHVVWQSAFTPRPLKIIFRKKNRTGGFPCRRRSYIPFMSWDYGLSPLPNKEYISMKSFRLNIFCDHLEERASSPCACADDLSIPSCTPVVEKKVTLERPSIILTLCGEMEPRLIVFGSALLITPHSVEWLCIRLLTVR